MFERRENPQLDPLAAPGLESQNSDASITSLVSSLLAARAAELRSAELALEVEFLRRKLDLHRRYSLTLSNAVEQALIALCGLPPLSNLREQTDNGDTAAGEPASSRSERESMPRSGEPESKPSDFDPGRIRGAVPTEGPPAQSASKAARSWSEAEGSAASLLDEASDILSRAQESARQILERALAQGSEIVAKAEAHSRLIDEKVTQVEAVTARQGPTIYQKALELARARDVDPHGSEEGGDSNTPPLPDAGLDRLELLERERAAASLHGRRSLSDEPSGVANARVSDRAQTPGTSSDGFSVTTVSVSRFRSFAPVVGLEKAVRALNGVRDVRVLGFRGGLLEMAVEHDPGVDLAAMMQALEGYRLKVLDSSDTRLSLELVASEKSVP